MVTTSIISNGKIINIEYVNEEWVYSETKEKVGALDLSKISIGNEICGLKCLRKHFSNDPDKARKLSIVLTRLEEALHWLRSIGLKEHHAITEETK